MPGTFVVSLDFELYWGVRDKRSLEAYRANLLGVRQAVPAMLSLFREYGVSATWAAVGFLFFDGRDELLEALPHRRPAYAARGLSPYDALQSLGRSEAEDPYHFAPSLLKEIAATPGQEVGTHTFSHYYCLEPGQALEDFSADLAAARRASQAKLGVEPRSIVFPRNQFNPRYLAACRAEGLLAYRGNHGSWLYEARNEEDESTLRRGVRLLDSYLPLSGTNTHAPVRLDAHGLVNVPASRFLRPHSTRLKQLDELRVRRISGDLEQAAKNGGLYHLWWHPHNFGVNLQDNLQFLRRILDGFSELRTRHSMQSAHMSAVAEGVMRRAA